MLGIWKTGPYCLSVAWGRACTDLWIHEWCSWCGPCSSVLGSYESLHSAAHGWTTAEWGVVFVVSLAVLLGQQGAVTTVFCKTISSIMSVEKNCAVPETFKTVFLKCFFILFTVFVHKLHANQWADFFRRWPPMVAYSAAHWMAFWQLRLCSGPWHQAVLHSLCGVLAMLAASTSY